MDTLFIYALSGSAETITLFLIFTKSILPNKLVIKYIVSGSNWKISSSPIISTIFKVKKALWLLSISFNKLSGTTYLLDSSSYLKFVGKENPSFIKASANAKSFAETKYLLFLAAFLKILSGSLN